LFRTNDSYQDIESELCGVDNKV